jgi:hypothetical protein
MPSIRLFRLHPRVPHELTPLSTSPQVGAAKDGHRPREVAIYVVSAQRVVLHTAAVSAIGGKSHVAMDEQAKSNLPPAE